MRLSVYMLGPRRIPPLFRRDEALSAVQQAMQEQQEKGLLVEAEISGLRKDVAKEQVGLRGSWKGGGLVKASCGGGGLGAPHRARGLACFTQSQGLG